MEAVIGRRENDNQQENRHEERSVRGACEYELSVEAWVVVVLVGVPGALTEERLGRAAPSVVGKCPVVPSEVRTAAIPAILVGVVSPSVAAVLPVRKDWGLGQRWAARARHQESEDQRADGERKEAG